ncbi:MAG: DUF4272 domain-containing protein [Myxococcaceae bacterium]
MADPLTELAGDLASDDPDLREEAARALAGLRDPRAGPPLSRALRDPEETVRMWGAYGLGRLKRPEDLPALRRALSEDRSATVRLWSAFGLVSLGERAEAATLLSFLDDESLDVRNNAADALISLEGKDPVRAPLERRLASSDGRTRAWAAGVLHRLGHPKAFAVWKAALFSAEARVDAAVVAHHLGEPRAGRELLRALAQTPVDELEAPVPPAGDLPAAEVLSAPLLELELQELLEEAAQDEALRADLLLLLSRGIGADPEVLDLVHGCLAGLEPGQLGGELCGLLARSPAGEQAKALGRICGYLPEVAACTVEALEPSARAALLAQVAEAQSGGGDGALEIAQLAELVRASPFADSFQSTRPALEALDEEEGEPVTSPGITAVDAPITAEPTDPFGPTLPPDDAPPGDEAPGGEEQLGPPTPAEAASRALCVAAVLQRWVIEQALSSGDLDPEEAGNGAEAVVLWIEEEQLVDALSPLEAALLSADLGAWADEERIDISWTAEALAQLMWSLGLAEAPAPDTAAELASMMEALPMLEDTAPFIAGAALKSPAELAAQREAWELWRWRARAEVTARNEGAADAPRPGVQQAAARLKEQGLLAKTLAGDFPWAGKPFGKVDEAELASATSISLERHRALHWLSLGGLWDEVALEQG